MTIQHPLTIGTKIKSNFPACPCTGKKFVELHGVIVKVTNRNDAFWYMLNNGHSVKAEWVIEIL